MVPRQNSNNAHAALDVCSKFVLNMPVDRSQIRHGKAYVRTLRQMRVWCPLFR